jgi:anti-sigma factor RsiW
MDCGEALQLRHLRIDGELDPAEVPALEAHLKRCAACREVFERERALSAALKVEVPRYRAPAMLRARIRTEIARSEHRSRFGELRLLRVGWNPLAVAASLLLAVVTSSAVTTAYWRGTGEDPLAQQVVAIHIRSLMADHLTDVPSSNQHTVKPWFNGKLDISPPVVDLAAAGYPLVGGRLDYLDKHPVAALVYSRQQHIINVLVLADNPPPKLPAIYAQQGYNVIHAARGDLGIWVVSDLNLAELNDFLAKFKDAVSDQASAT